MTRGSVQEYVAALRPWYRKASKGEKRRLLDEAVQVTGRHRKTLIRLFAGRRRPPAQRRPGRPKSVTPAMLEGLRWLWEVSDYPCGKRLQPFLPELIASLNAHGELRMPEAVAAALTTLSAATIDRALQPARAQRRPRPLSLTKPGTLLKEAIPIRTHGQWDEGRPGFIEVDLVAHCGETTEGFYLTTLTAVDVATGWVACQPVWGKGQERVGGAIHRVRERLPMPLLGLDSDNGSEFINHRLYAYCQRQGITFTRSRPYRKNDTAHVEQKNWMAVRRLVGYDRYATKAAFAAMERLYQYLEAYVNFFQPSMQLQEKTREGAKVRKVYATAKTPYQRVLESGVLSDTQQQRLERLRDELNPVWLRNHLAQGVQRLWKLAVQPGAAHPAPPDVLSDTHSEATVPS